MPQIRAYGFKLVDSETKSPISEGAVRSDFRGEKWIVTGGTPPHKPSSTGRVFCKPVADADSPEQHSHSYFPGTLGLEWQDANAR